MNWNNLSLQDRADYIKLGVQSGLRDIDSVKSLYNQYAKGGPVKVRGRAVPHPKGMPNEEVRALQEAEDARVQERYNNDKTFRDSYNNKYKSIRRQDEQYSKILEVSNNRPLDTEHIINLQDSISNNSKRVVQDLQKGYKKAVNNQIEDAKDNANNYKKILEATATAGELLSAYYILGNGLKVLNKLPNNRFIDRLYNYDKGPAIASSVSTLADAYQLATANTTRDYVENAVELPLDVGGIIGGSDWFRNTPLFGKYGKKIDMILDAGSYGASIYDGILKPEWALYNSLTDKKANGGPLNKELDNSYQEWKNSLPKNLRNESDNYDLYGAYKAGLQPNLEDDGYYHLGSRDPKTNRILKKPTHPTYLKAIIDDIHKGYYPVTKGNETYTLPLPFKYNETSIIHPPFKFGDGGNTSPRRYKPSTKIQNRIATWEGSEMLRNRPFDEVTLAFNGVLPQGAIDKLNQEQLDGLYSYAYNVGPGRFKQRVASVLTKYLAGQATVQDVQNSMWASGDAKLRGLAKRRAVERQMFGSGITPTNTSIVDKPIHITPVTVSPNLSFVPPVQMQRLPVITTPSVVNNVPNNEDLPNILNSYNDIMSLHPTYNNTLANNSNY